MDDKTLHELYLWPFQEAVRAGTGNIMCSYNRLNNSYACQNSKILNGILKEELGFQGFVVTDWDAQHTGVASAISGLDMVMPTTDFWGNNLSEAVANGSLPLSRIDDMATRILATWYQMGQDSSAFSEPGVGMPLSLLSPHKSVDARSSESRSTIFQGAVEGHVLLKNTNSALPLKNPRMLSVYGYDAMPPLTYDPAYTTYDWMLGENDASFDALLCGTYGIGNCPAPSPPFINRTLWTGGGSAATTPSYISSPYDALMQYSIDNNVAMYWDFITANSTSNVDTATDACLVFINAFSTEGADRSSLRDDFSDQLVLNIAAQCPNTIVVVHNVAVRLVDSWIDHPNVTAVLFGHVPGQDSGRAAVELLFGKQSPSGKLPYTIAKNESDYGHLLGPDLPEGEYIYYPQSNFSEGVYTDYRYFDKHDIEPRFEFGFGLSYTTFEYSTLRSSVANGSSVAMYPTGKVIPGGPEDLFDVVATVQATVKNTGSVKGAEVAQLYVGIPGDDQPVRQLRGFEKVLLAPEEEKTVSFPLRRRDLSVWDVNAQKWALQKGDYQIFVGASSRQLLLDGTLTIGGY